MNQKAVHELLKQLQQENQDIGEELNIANIIIWMKKEAYEPTSARALRSAFHLATRTFQNR